MIDKGAILLVGVGGQGITLATKIVSLALLKSGFDVKVSEIHGMAQRGGSVYGMVRFGKEVYSPIISQGEADILMAFELLEAARWLIYLKPGGELILGEQTISPMPVLLGKMDYPSDLISQLKDKTEKLLTLNAEELAFELGGLKFANMITLGTLKERLPITQSAWEDAIEESIPERFIEINMKAFELGRKQIMMRGG